MRSLKQGAALFFSMRLEKRNNPINFLFDGGDGTM
jgi:hypothetical protein